VHLLDIVMWSQGSVLPSHSNISWRNERLKNATTLF